MNTFFKYNAKITRVVDGDTVDALVDLGFKTYRMIRFRLTGFDAPESYRPKDKQEKEAGNAATEELKRMIEGKEVIIHSNKHGKYRYLATIYMSERDTISVNEGMIALGHTKEAMELRNEKTK